MKSYQILGHKSLINFLEGLKSVWHFYIIFI
jgi:hypothetical protein